MSEVTILDGGMGKELRRIGAPFRQPEWSALALMDTPHFVSQAHDNFVAAGAEVIITSVYAVVPFHIGDDRFATRGADLITLGADLARQSADRADHEVRVAGSLPPLFGSYQPEAFDPARAADLWRLFVQAQNPFVDRWIGETMSSTAEYAVLSDVLSDVSNTESNDKPVWASFCLADRLIEGRAQLRSGESVTTMATVVARSGAEAVLFNCSQPEVIGPALSELASAMTDLGADIRVSDNANVVRPVRRNPRC